MTLSVSPMARRSIGTSILRGLLLIMAQLPALHSYPLMHKASHSHAHKLHAVKDDVKKNPQSGQFWLYIGVSITLVLLGGVFAGLTLGLMGQDEIYLQVIEQSGDANEKKHAKSVLRLLKRGKHWVLVTLLLSNVITNETLPIVLDRGLGGGWPAVLSSTILIVIFGEIIPQSVCVRYGLSIGAYLSPFVLFLMYLMYPIAYPTALLLDHILGEDHGTTYKKAGLKTLVTLHKTLGPTPADRLNQDEVTIISAVLDLKEKPVGNIMTPMEDVFIMSADTVLDEETMDSILCAGYSRIPIHAPGEPTNFIGMLLVKMLITYDPEDGLKVSDFSLATLPETAPETSCLDIVNFFQEGKSHMVLVSEYPGENYGALGVVTLEDVIEELIGEEIIDESDVYIDVHKAIRRLNPAPIARRTWSSHVVPQDKMSNDVVSAAANEIAGAIAEADAEEQHANANAHTHVEEASAPPRRSVETDGGRISFDTSLFPLRRKLSGGNLPPALAESLRHLGPSNQASNPKKTLSKTVKIKTGAVAEDHGKNILISSPIKPKRQVSFADHSTPPSHALNRSSDQHENVFEEDETEEANQTTRNATISSNIPVLRKTPRPGSGHSSRSGNGSPSSEYSFKKVKTGSLIEINKEIGGVKKVIVEATSSSDSEESPRTPLGGSRENLSRTPPSPSQQPSDGGESSKKKRKKKKKKATSNGGPIDLLTGDSPDEGAGGGRGGEDDDADEGTSLLGKT